MKFIRSFDICAAFLQRNCRKRCWNAAKTRGCFPRVFLVFINI
nr:MAG TPA: hypothetical protein [Caudoviricetes sp.]DAS78467.1 MAG TPA: hypothetical protein [Caudoviricetes sp.]